MSRADDWITRKLNEPPKVWEPIRFWLCLAYWGLTIAIALAIQAIVRVFFHVDFLLWGVGAGGFIAAGVYIFSTLTVHSEAHQNRKRQRET